MIKTSLLPFFPLEALASSSVTAAVSCEEVESPNCRGPLPVLMISHGQGKMGKKLSSLILIFLFRQKGYDGLRVHGNVRAALLLSLEYGYDILNSIKFRKRTDPFVCFKQAVGQV